MPVTVGKNDLKLFECIDATMVFTAFFWLKGNRANYQLLIIIFVYSCMCNLFTKKTFNIHRVQ